MSFKRFLICSSGHPPVQRSETIYEILKEGSMGIIQVMKCGPVVQEKMLFHDISYLELSQPLCPVDWNHLCIFKECIMRNIPVKPYCIWTNGSGGNAV